MEILFYFGKVILTSGVMFLYYRLFLKDKTFHHYNRFYLLAASLISLVLPLLKVSYFTLEVNSNMYLLIKSLQNLSSTKTPNNDFLYISIIAVAFGLVAVFFLTKLIFGLVKIQVLKKKFRKENFEGISFYQTNLENAPFSFFKNLFWKDSILIQSDLGKQILKHEMVHIEQRHSWDKIFLEITTALFWFNPFFYLIKKEINLIHEYLADHKALKNSDTKAFAQMLLASHFSGKQLPATSPFLSSNLKKRLTMLKKSKTKFSYARRILALPLIFTLAFMYLVNAKNNEIKATNHEIEKTISTVKSDTIAPNIEKNQVIQKNKNGSLGITPAVFVQHENTGIIPAKNIAYGTDGTKLYQEHPELFVDNDSAAQAEDFKLTAFRKRILDAEKRATEAEKRVNSPAFKKRIKDAERRAREADDLVNSPAFKQSLRDADQAAKDAQVALRDSKIAMKDSERAIKDSKTALNDSKSSSLKSKEYPDIYINGRPSTHDEMQKLDPNTIESMHVFKKGFEGKEKGEIYIKLKK